MLCDICKKNNATVHVTKIVNGVKQEFNICEECAKKTEGIGISQTVDFNTPFSFQNILSGIMDYLYESPHNIKTLEPVCKNCGITFTDFKNNGLLGCSECYENFRATLIPVVKRVQGNVEHTGKVPKKSGKAILEKKNLLRLREELQACVKNEEYEKAAELRDKIREIESGQGTR